ncbi:hypothetical protein L7F22_040259 [Adiantum nelumboides]|nr:hypothetical protein [Adiantum nelumboides]
MGQGSLNDVDPILAAEESNLQIVPWEIKDEVSAVSRPKDESNVFTHKGTDILASTKLFSCFECPPIPLCRLFPYVRVRGLRDDLSGLKSAFAKEGHMQEKRSFIVSLWTCQKEEKFVTDKENFSVLCCKISFINAWDPLWGEVNEEFENKLQSNPKLSDKHSRILCTIIDPTKVPEIALLSSLQRMNFMNSHSLVTTHLTDEIMNLTHICAADPNVYLRALPEKDQKLIADVQMTKEYNTKVDQLSGENLNEGDLKKEQEKTYHDVTNKYSDKIGKLLNIVDPHLGSDWLVKVLSLKWGFGSWATLEKINLIAIGDAPIQNKLQWLSLLEADNLTRAAYVEQAFIVAQRRGGNSNAATSQVSSASGKSHVPNAFGGSNFFGNSGDKGKKKMHCHYCKANDNLIKQCPKLKAKEAKKKEGGSTANVGSTTIAAIVEAFVKGDCDADVDAEWALSAKFTYNPAVHDACMSVAANSHVW